MMKKEHKHMITDGGKQETKKIYGYSSKEQRCR